MEPATGRRERVLQTLEDSDPKVSGMTSEELEGEEREGGRPALVRAACFYLSIYLSLDQSFENTTAHAWLLVLAVT